MTLQQIPYILSTKSINFVYSPKLSLLGIESGDFCWVRDLQLTVGWKNTGDDNILDLPYNQDARHNEGLQGC